jgi:hypothetical protein
VSNARSSGTFVYDWVESKTGLVSLNNPSIENRLKVDQLLGHLGTALHRSDGNSDLRHQTVPIFVEPGTARGTCRWPRLSCDPGPDRTATGNTASCFERRARMDLERRAAGYSSIHVTVRARAQMRTKRVPVQRVKACVDPELRDEGSISIVQKHYGSWVSFISMRTSDTRRTSLSPIGTRQYNYRLCASHSGTALLGLFSIRSRARLRACTERLRDQKWDRTVRGHRGPDKRRIGRVGICAGAEVVPDRLRVRGSGLV